MTNEITRKTALKGLALTARALAVPKIVNANYQPTDDELEEGNKKRTYSEGEIRLFYKTVRTEYNNGVLRTSIPPRGIPIHSYIYPEGTNVILGYDHWSEKLSSLTEKDEIDRKHTSWPTDPFFPSFKDTIDEITKEGGFIEVESEYVEEIIRNYRERAKNFSLIRRIEEQNEELFYRNVDMFRKMTGNVLAEE